jgi:cytochrome c-type biogenesis protein CcmH
LGKAVALWVELVPALRSRLQPDAPLFVLARNPAGGPPVAVVRRTAGELPFDLTLTDKNVMTPGMTLGMFGELALVARVSFSGRPMATSGDLFGEIRYDFRGGQPVRLIIDRVVP